MSASLIFDLSYIATQNFSSEGIYAFYCFLILVRFIGPLFNMMRYYFMEMKGQDHRDLLSPTNAVLDEESEGKNSDELHAEFKRNGLMLYLAVPFSQITGIYRMLNYKNFHKEVAFGLSVDAVLNMLCMLIVQAVNNS